MAYELTWGDVRDGGGPGYAQSPPRRSGSRGLELTRPLVAIDLETTGLDVREDRIVEIACIKLLPFEHESFPRGESGAVDPPVGFAEEIFTTRINPRRSICPEATAVHGLRDEDVCDAPQFAAIAPELLAFLSDCDLTGFNLLCFDLPMLTREFERVGQVFPAPGTQLIDSRRIYLAKEPRTLSAAYQLYCQRSLEQAHRAESDARAAADVLLAQIQRYPDLPRNVQGLSSYCGSRHRWLDADGRLIWRNDELVLGFGKYRYRPLREVQRHDPTYIEWVLADGFEPEVVSVVLETLQSAS